MMRSVSEIVKRMRETPAKAEELVLKRGECADGLHNALDGAKRIEIQVAGQVASERNRERKPVYANGAMREFEEMRRLTAHKEYQELQGKVETHRNALRCLDAALESLRLRAKSDEQVMSLVTALLTAGRTEDAKDALAAYEGVNIPDEAQKDESRTAETTPIGDGTETAVFTVLEVRAGKSAGTVRAFCEGSDGRYAIFGKNGIGQILAGAIGKQVEVRYRHGDKGLIALSATMVS